MQFQKCYDLKIWLNKRRNFKRGRRRHNKWYGPACHAAWVHSHSPSPQCCNTAKEFKKHPISLDQKTNAGNRLTEALNYKGNHSIAMDLSFCSCPHSLWNLELKVKEWKNGSVREQAKQSWKSTASSQKKSWWKQNRYCHMHICGEFSWVTYLKAYLVGLGDLIAMTFTCSPTSKTVATLGTRARAILLMCTNPLPYHTERKKRFEISCRRIASF